MLSFRAEIPKNRFEGLEKQSILRRVLKEKQAELAKKNPNAELSEVEQTGENTAQAKLRFFRSRRLGRFSAVQLYSGLNKNGTQHLAGIQVTFEKSGKNILLKRAFFARQGRAILEREGQDKYPIISAIKLLKARLNAR